MFPSNINIEMTKTIDEGDFERELQEVAKLNFLSAELTKLESETLSTEEQSEIISSIFSQLSNMSCYVTRLEQILSRNLDFDFFRRFNILKCTEAEKIYSFLPLTTVEVERSFSKYRDILSDKRRSLSTENLEKYLMIYFNPN